MFDVGGWVAALAWALAVLGVAVLARRQWVRRHRLRADAGGLRALRHIQQVSPPTAPGTRRFRP